MKELWIVSLDMENISELRNNRKVKKVENALNKIKKTISREGMFECWLCVEAALAKAQGSLGIIPEEASRQIQKSCHVECLDIERYDMLYQKTGHPMVAMLKLLEEAVGKEAGQYIHLGATTQDIIDTATVLAMKEMMETAEQKLASILRCCCRLAEDYAEVPMMGRTHNIQALPITFGYKAAVWADEFLRCYVRIRESEKRILALQMSGAVGSMVSFGNDGEAIQKRMAEELGLSVPAVSWHASRDRMGEFASVMSLIGCALGRCAQEIYLLMGTEIGELSEYWGEGRVGSSTMPHKVNPTNTQHIKGITTRLRYLSAEIQELMLVDHERNMQHSIEEQKAVEEICVCVAEVLDRGEELLDTLVVNKENMKRNLYLLGGLTQSEHIMLELGRKIGKQNAHRLVNKIAVDSFQNHLSFEEELKKNEEIVSNLGTENIHNLLDPMQYIGKCPEIAKKVAGKIRSELGE